MGFGDRLFEKATPAPKRKVSAPIPLEPLYTDKLMPKLTSMFRSELQKNAEIPQNRRDDLPSFWDAKTEFIAETFYATVKDNKAKFLGYFGADELEILITFCPVIWLTFAASILTDTLAICTALSAR